MVGWIQSSLEAGYQSISFHMLLVFLLLDAHSSHYQPQLIEYAREFGEIMFRLPPDTIHESQPLDASVFKSLKQIGSMCVVILFNLIRVWQSSLLNEAWGSTINPMTMCSGF